MDASPAPATAAATEGTRLLLKELGSGLVDASRFRIPRVECTHGPQAGRLWGLDVFPFSIGRAPDNRVVLHDPRVSRRHATILERQGVAYLEPFPGAEVTVDGRCVRSAIRLLHDSVIELGDTSLLFRDETRIPERPVVSAPRDARAPATPAAPRAEGPPTEAQEQPELGLKARTTRLRRAALLLAAAGLCALGAAVLANG